MKKKAWLIVLPLAALLVVIITIRIKDSGSSKRVIPIPLVVAGKAVRGEIVKTDSLTGDILPDQQAAIYPKVNGNIEKILVDMGDAVQQGAILALIDSTIYSQNMKQAKANFMQMSANFQNAQNNYRRNEDLFKQRLISRQDFDNSKTAMDVAQAQKEAANAIYKNAETQLSYCTVTAPFSGTIIKRFLDTGAYVSPSGGSAGSTLFVLMNVKQLKSIVNVPEKDVPLLKEVIDIQVVADALPGLIFKAKLKRISEAVDVTTRTMAVEVEIEKPGGLLKPGMFATINFILERKADALILPNGVVLNDDKGNFVYLINPDSTVTKKYVTLGSRQDNKDEVISGITEDDAVVFVGQSLIRDRMKVRLAVNQSSKGE
ncbi:MAG: efflux RND transporter periplasmic adaptor subunit [bacterium]